MSYIIDTYVEERQGPWRAEVKAEWLVQTLPDGWTRWSLSEWDEFLLDGSNATWVKDSIESIEGVGHPDSDHPRTERLIALEVYNEDTRDTVVFG